MKILKSLISIFSLSQTLLKKNYLNSFSLLYLIIHSNKLGLGLYPKPFKVILEILLLYNLRLNNIVLFEVIN